MIFIQKKPIRLIWQLVSVFIFVFILAGCVSPSPEQLEMVNYAPITTDIWAVSTPEEQGLDPDLVAELYYNADQLPTVYSLLVFKNGYLVTEDYMIDWLRKHM